MKRLWPVVCIVSLLSGCDYIPPYFDFVRPEVTGFHFGDTLRVDFSEVMNHPRTEDAFRLDSDVGVVEGAFAWEGTTLVFQPYTPFTAERRYTLTVGTGAEDLRGNSLAEEYTAFPGKPEDLVPPRVTSFKPRKGAVVEEPRPEMSISFSEPVLPEGCTTTLRISPNISFTPDWNEDGTEVTLRLLEDLSRGTEYRIDLDGGCTDLSFNPLTPTFSLYFRRAEEEEPEVLSVTALASNFVLNPLVPASRNAGMRHDETFAVEFSKALPRQRAVREITLSPSVDIDIRTGEEPSLILTPEEPLEYGVVYTLRVLDRTFNLLCDAPESAPPEVSRMYFSVAGGPGMEVTLENNLSGPGDRVDLYIYISSGQDVLFSSVLESFHTESTNACVDLDILSVTADPVLPADLPAPAAGERIYLFSGSLEDTPGPGIITVIIDTSLTTVAGVSLSRKAMFQVSNY